MAAGRGLRSKHAERHVLSVRRAALAASLAPPILSQYTLTLSVRLSPDSGRCWSGMAVSAVGKNPRRIRIHKIGNNGSSLMNAATYVQVGVMVPKTSRMRLRAPVTSIHRDAVVSGRKG